jgi:hypothetical protein
VAIGAGVYLVAGAKLSDCKKTIYKQQWRSNKATQRLKGQIRPAVYP